MAKLDREKLTTAINAELTIYDNLLGAYKLEIVKAVVKAVMKQVK